MVMTPLKLYAAIFELFKPWIFSNAICQKVPNYIVQMIFEVQKVKIFTFKHF